ncbi:ricin-type beta-trefoil lectin domain protein [Kitasatospora purpeofusca]|uniref:ricin-type beta-trefoil lectin domain protein n=1 Tax=Kitasatospora purpeofusca TaxID=67352 RepID=UPI0004BFA5DC|nr:ricin-type beta-trefoil lectin domain protein [Kitasatospora purpeofusca]
MRRTTAMFATALLAGAAALTAPATAGAATSAPAVAGAAGAAAAPAALTAGSCTVTRAGLGFLGTCTDIDPMQTWRVAGTCQTIGTNGIPVYSAANGSWVTGNTRATATCFGTAMPQSGWIVAGPAVPAGPVGQISGYANKCVDVRGGINGNGTPVQIWDCLGNAAQTWKVGTDGTVRAFGKCLDVQGGNTGNATLVQIYDCNGSGAQQWQARADGSLLNPQSGRCLDDLGYSTTNGNQLGIWDCNGAANQVWHLPV